MDFKIFGVILTLLALLVYVVLQWMNLPVGNFGDWLIAIIAFWWMLLITIYPWNIHFQAREVLIEAALSKERGIEVKPGRVKYARNWARISLLIAIALHLGSALVLYFLSAAGITSIGYVGSGVVLALTFLRPVIRAYRYLIGRLAAIRHEIQYPREDVFLLRDDLSRLSDDVKYLQEKMNTENGESWAARQEAEVGDLRRTLQEVRSALDALRDENVGDHRRLALEAEQALARISEDGQFLSHVREIIRFFKKA